MASQEVKSECSDTSKRIRVNLVINRCSLRVGEHYQGEGRGHL